MAQFKKLKKQIKHKKQQEQHVKQIVKTMFKPKLLDDKPLVERLRYPPVKGDLVKGKFANFMKNANNPLNLQSTKFMTPVRRRLEEDTDYKENDSRILICQQPLQTIAKGDSRVMLSGILAGYRYTLKNKNIRVYLLVRDVRGIIKNPKDGRSHWKSLTDHLWIDINNGWSDSQYQDIVAGIGDELVFYGEFDKYRGYRNDIKQDKVGLQGVVMVSAGYPTIRYEQANEAEFMMQLSIQFGFPVQYNHRDDYLIAWPNRADYPAAIPSFGKQMPHEVRTAYTNPYFRVMNSANVDLYHQLKYGYYNIKDDANLIFDYPKAQKFDFDNCLYWSRSIKESTDDLEIVINSAELNPRTSFEDVYNRICDKHHLRKTIHGRKPNNHTNHPKAKP